VHAMACTYGCEEPILAKNPGIAQKQLKNKVDSRMSSGGLNPNEKATQGNRWMLQVGLPAPDMAIENETEREKFFHLVEIPWILVGIPGSLFPPSHHFSPLNP
jgi:hypothetical protein